jgi:hypothetical protein
MIAVRVSLLMKEGNTIVADLIGDEPQARITGDGPIT